MQFLKVLWVLGMFSVGLVSVFGGFGMVYSICSAVVGGVVIAGCGSCLFWFFLSSWFMLDQISYLMLFLVLVVFYLSLVSSINDYKLSAVYLSGVEFSIFLVSFISALFFTVSGWMSLFFLYEAALLPTLWLIMKWGYQPERLQAGFMLMIYAVCSSLPMVVSLLSMAGSGGTDGFLISFMFGLVGSFCSGHYWVWMFVFFAFLVKVPIYVFHGWLPKAHVEAPLSASMILAGVLLKLGVFGLIRFIWVMELSACKFIFLVVAFSLWGGVISSTICSCQNDLKSLIAYSSIGHMSFCVAGVFSLSSVGEMASVVILFAHGICSPCLFSLAACNYDMSESRSVALNKGLLKVFPLISGFWLFMCVGNMSCPPSINFFGEVFSISAVMSVSMWFAIPMAIMCFMAGVYCLYLYSVVNHGSFSVMMNSVFGYGERYVYVWLYGVFIIFMGFLMLDFLLV